MDIVLYNSSCSQVPTINEAAYLAAYLLMADTIHYDSTAAAIMLIFEHLDEFSDDIILDLNEENGQGIEEDLALIAKIRKRLPEYYKAKKLKNKNKKILRLIGLVNIALKSHRKLVKTDYEIKCRENSLFDLLPFYQNDKLDLEFGDYEIYDENENKYLTRIAERLIERNATISLSNHIEIFSPFQILTSANKTKCDFIKIPLWKFPYIVSTPYEHINYTREQLLPILQPFKDILKQLQTDFYSLDFTEENIPLFKLKIQEKIIPLAIPIQDAIDGCIYLSRLRNNFAKFCGLVFCLGIAPADTIVNYYQQIGLFEPYEANEIKTRISRHISLNSTYIFTYFEIHN